MHFAFILKVAICTDTRRCRAGSVGIATCYRLDGPGIEFRLGRDFPHTPILLRNLCRVILGGKAAVAWRGLGHPPPSTTEVKERVELYLYSSVCLYCISRCVAKYTICLPFNGMFSCPIVLLDKPRFYAPYYARQITYSFQLQRVSASTDAVCCSLKKASRRDIGRFHHFL